MGKQQAAANEHAIFSSITKLKTMPDNAKKYVMLNRHGEIADSIVNETLKEFAKQDAELARKEGREFAIDQAGAEKLLAEACDHVEEWYRGQFKDLVGNDDVVEMLMEMGFSKKQAEAAAQAAEAAPAAPAAPPAPSKTITPRVSATAASAMPGRETAAQKRARLEESLRTGNRSLLRA